MTGLRGINKRASKLMFLMFGGAIGLILLVIGGYQLLEFSDSLAFCGQLCHTVMYPEYTTHSASPHSNVSCADCHVGSGATYLVRSKISGVPQVFIYLTNSYERPIAVPVRNLRPARETCEECHRPEFFAGDVVRLRITYAPNEANTRTTDTRVMRVGGGEQGAAQGIHWHIAAKVYYLPLDDQRQQIAWVGVEQADGTLQEWVDPAYQAEVTPQRLQAEKRLMDCIDCHNRATHIYSSPEDLIDTAMAQGKIDTSLPYIKQQGLKVLTPVDSNLDVKNGQLDALKNYYQTNYPQVAQQKGAQIDAAIVELKNIAKLTTFPDMKVTWMTYADNIGHQQWPGCFRCHGKLQATTGSQQGHPVNADCTLCHYFNLNQAFNN